MRLRRSQLLCAVLALALAGCGGEAPSGPVRTPLQAGEIAQKTLRSAGLDEEIVDVRRLGEGWLVTTRRRETSLAGHLVTVDAVSGAAKVERYRSIQLGTQGPR